MVYNLKLSNSIMGWMLVPSYRCPAVGIEELLNLLYAQDWLSMKSSDRAFMKGEPIEVVVAHIKEVCKDLKIKVSVCGNRKLPTLRIWWNKVEHIEPEKLSVDLKWSCWSVDRGYWGEYAPGVWERMEAAFKGEAGPVVVHTGPRKEIRYGSVTIYKGGACGQFSCEWDSVEELADTLGVKCDEAFRETIPYSSHLMEPGTDWEFGTIKARKFQRLMNRIDGEENEFMVHDVREWNGIKACFSRMGSSGSSPNGKAG